jgi:hypothetical protein
MRTLQPGDNWIWEMEETTRSAGDEKTTSARGTKSISVAYSDFDGKRTLALSGTMEQFGKDEVKRDYKWVEYIAQNENRDIVIHGDTEGENGALRKLAAPVLFWPGIWSRTTTFATEAKYDDGFTVRCKLTVKGTEELETPIGKLSCWTGERESSIDYKDAKNVSIDRRTFWFAPQIGALVKERWTTIEHRPNAKERRREGSFSLQSANVPNEPKE